MGQPRRERKTHKVREPPLNDTRRRHEKKGTLKMHSLIIEKIIEKKELDVTTRIKDRFYHCIKVIKKLNLFSGDHLNTNYYNYIIKKYLNKILFQKLFFVRIIEKKKEIEKEKITNTFLTSMHIL